MKYIHIDMSSARLRSKTIVVFFNGLIVDLLGKSKYTFESKFPITTH